jgi:hypothetical protein
MEPQERTQLVTRLLEEATRMQTVLEQAMAAKEQEAAQIEASGHITDDEPSYVNVGIRTGAAPSGVTPHPSP